MKKKFLLTVITVLFAAIGSVGSVSVAANRKESHGRYWAKESFTVNNRKGVIDASDNLYATRIILKIPPKESSKSSKDIADSDTDAADQG